MSKDKSKKQTGDLGDLNRQAAMCTTQRALDIAEKLLANARARVQALAEDLKAAKAEVRDLASGVDEAMEQYRDACRGYIVTLPLWAGARGTAAAADTATLVDPATGEETVIATRPADAPADAPAPQAAAGDDAWRAVPLKGLGSPEIKAATLKALAEHNPPLLTVGELSDWQAKKGDFWASDVKGVGPAAREKIEDALAAFWARRNADGGKEAA